jgi:hypothetical protein
MNAIQFALTIVTHVAGTEVGRRRGANSRSARAVDSDDAPKIGV